MINLIKKRFEASKVLRKREESNKVANFAAKIKIYIMIKSAKYHRIVFNKPL